MRRKLVPWDYYRKRRNIELRDYLQSRSVKDYSALQRLFDKEGVECPSEAEYRAAAAPKKTAPAKKPVAVKKPAADTPKKPARKRKAPAKKPAK